MDDDDDDFWITEIANTPEDDADYVPIGKIMLIIAAVVLIGLLIALLR